MRAVNLLPRQQVQRTRERTNTVALGAVAAAASPRSAPERPVSQLMKDHVEVLHELEMRFPPERRSNVDVNAIKTEAEASAYILQVMTELHGHIGDHR